MRVIDFNINDSVKIKLTDYGRKVLKKDWDDFWDDIKKQHPKTKKFKYSHPKEDEDGWSTWQMWLLMEQLGKYVGMGLKDVFETNIKVEAKV